VDGVVPVGNGNNIFGAVEFAAKVWNCWLPSESIQTALHQNFWWCPNKRQIPVDENCGFDQYELVGFDGWTSTMGWMYFPQFMWSHRRGLRQSVSFWQHRQND
jgi:hypothetical protein